LTPKNSLKNTVIEHIEVADEFITSKNPDLTRFFIIKPRHPRGLKKADLSGKNPQWEPLHGHMGKNAYKYYSNLKLTFEDLLPRYCYATKTQSRTIR